MKRMQVGLAIASLVVSTAAFTGTAVARDYSNNNSPNRSSRSTPAEVLGETETTTAPELPFTAEVEPAAETSPSSAELPFTGGDVLELTAIGAGLVAVGVVMTRSRRRQTSAA